MQNKESDDDRNYGLRISAGSTASDTAFFVQDHDASNDYFIIRGNGKVGIGTTSPDNKLHVSFADATAVTGANIDSDAISGIHIACTGNDTNAGGMLKFSSRGTNVVSAIAHQQMGTNTSDLVFFTGVSDGSPTEKMRIDSGGNLSLKNGTLSAEAGSGGAYATEVHTELGASSTVISYFDSLGGASWTGQIRFRTSSGGGSLGERMRLENDGTVQIYGTCSIQGITETKNIRARDNDSYDIGTSSKLYDDIYATNGTIQTSDARLKESVEDSKLGLDFLNKHRPVSYKQKGKTRRHYGLIAQEVEKVLIDSSISTEDFAPLIKDDLKDDNDVKTGENIYGMRYTEYVGSHSRANLPS